VRPTGTPEQGSLINPEVSISKGKPCFSTNQCRTGDALYSIVPPGRDQILNRGTGAGLLSNCPSGTDQHCTFRGYFRVNKSIVRTSIQGLKFAYRSGRFFLVARHLKYKAQFYRVLKVNCLSRFYVDRLWVVIDQYIVMANNAISRQDSKPIISAIADPQVRSVIQIEYQTFDEGTDRRTWAIHNDGAKVRARFRSRHGLSGGCDRQHGNDRQ
jgi:hypothetical protein